MKKNEIGRRSFFKVGLMSLASLPLLAKWNPFSSEALANTAAKGAGSCPATAPAGKTAVDPNGAPAKRLDFVLNAQESKHNLHKAGDTCANCTFYRKEKEDGSWAPCTMLSMKFVPGCGWCKSYKKKA